MEEFYFQSSYFPLSSLHHFHYNCFLFLPLCPCTRGSQRSIPPLLSPFYSSTRVCQRSFSQAFFLPSCVINPLELPSSAAERLQPGETIGDLCSVEEKDNNNSSTNNNEKDHDSCTLLHIKGEKTEKEKNEWGIGWRKKNKKGRISSGSVHRWKWVNTHAEFLLLFLLPCNGAPPALLMPIRRRRKGRETHYLFDLGTKPLHYIQKIWERQKGAKQQRNKEKE